jgi:acyl-CoA thioesterase FadM
MDGEVGQFATGGDRVLRSSRRHVTMADVDAAGVLYFGAPYPWMEELFSGWLRDLGHPLVHMLHERAACPCVSSCATYPAPAFVDDELVLELAPTHVGTTSFGLTMTARRVRDDVVVVHSGEWHVWALFGGGGPMQTLTGAPLPEWLRESLTSVPLRPAPRPGASSPTPLEATHG